MNKVQYSESEIGKWKLAGKISAQALEYGASLIREGARVLEVCDAVDAKIIELGAIPSFPSQVSMDDVAAHFCPAADDSLVLSNEVVKLDVGACVDGFLGDNAVTVDLSGSHSDLVKASRDALGEALKAVKPGVKVSEIGAAIESVIRGMGFSPIVNLSGHGIGRFEVHASPTIPNFDNGDNCELYDGQVIAIEPFATNGAGAIYESSNPTVFMEISAKPMRSGAVREVMLEIQHFEGLPFTTRWLTRKFPAFKVNFALKQLISNRVIHAFPPLIERKRGLVSQSEHTVLVRDNPVILTKAD